MSEQYLKAERNLIGTLLTYPNRAAQILELNQELLDADLVRMIEQVATQMVASGSQEAADFLQNLAAQLREEVTVLARGERTNEQFLEAERHLIRMLLTYPHQAAKILTANQQLLTLDLVQEMERVASRMAASGSQESADFLQNLAAQLREEITPPAGTNDLDVGNHSLIIAPKKPNKFRFSWSGTILLLLSFLIFLTSQSGSSWLSDLPKVIASQSDSEPEIKKSQERSILPVEAIGVKLVNSYQVLRTYTGTVAASRLSELGFERSGQLINIIVNEGDRVDTGTSLAYLDTTNLKAQELELVAQRTQAVAQLKEMQAGPRAETIAAARAKVRDLDAQQELVRKKFDRRKELYAEGAISREQLDEAASNQFVLQARLEEAKSQLDELLAGTRPERIEAQKASIQEIDARIAKLKSELVKSILRAPFAGTISIRQVDEGTVVAAGQSILRLVEHGALEVRIGIPVPTASKLQLGSYQRLKIGQKTYQARVSSILPELDSSTRTLTVVLTLDKSAAREVSPGQVARLELAETISNSGYWLPTTALVRGRRGLWSCYVIGEPAELESLPTDVNQPFRIERRDVEVLHTESDRVLVRGTLQPGDQVIVNGTHRLVPGKLVQHQGNSYSRNTRHN